MITLKKSVLPFILLFSFSHLSYAEQQEEQSTIVGSSIGAAAGSLLGYQFGGGRGKYVTTAIGAVGGYLLGGNIQQRMQQNEQQNQPFYEPEYTQQSGRMTYVGQDDYLIKQHLSDQRKRRNMIRNGEPDPMEMPYDTSEVQTSWDDPNN